MIFGVIHVMSYVLELDHWRILNIGNTQFQSYIHASPSELPGDPSDHENVRGPYRCFFSLSFSFCTREASLPGLTGFVFLFHTFFILCFQYGLLTNISYNKLYSEFMHQSCVRNFSDNIYIEVMFRFE